MEPKLRFKEFNGDWEETQLQNEVNIIMGQSPSSNSYNEEKIGVPLVQGNADIKNRITSPTRYTNKPTKICKKDSLIMTVRAPVGYVGKANQEVCIGRGVCEIQVKKCNSDYIYQFLLNKEDSWDKISQGSTFTSISSNDIKKLNINIPSLPEQTKIADFLSTVDEKIQNQQDKITHLENIKKGFMQKIFSRKIRFKDANGNEFPEWEEKKLEDTIETIIDNRGKTPPISSSGYPLIEIASMQNNGLNYRKIEKYVSDETYKTWFRNHIKADDILFSTVGAYSGSLSYYDGKIKSCIAQNIIGLRFAQNSKFMMYLLSEKENQKRIQNIKMNQAQPSIKVTQIIKLKFLIPCLKEQQKIADFLSSFDEKIDVEKETLEHLKELKKGLLQQMFV